MHNQPLRIITAPTNPPPPSPTANTIALPTDVPPAILDIFQNSNPVKEVNTSQDIIDNILYYGVTVDGKSYLIGSDKSVTPFELLGSRGLSPKLESVMRSKFSHQGVLDFLRSDSPIAPLLLFKDLLRYYRRFIYLEKDEHYVLLTVWTMMTYVFMSFRYIPYLHLNGEKGSGKTLTLDVMMPLCFNGQSSVGSTTAVIYREITACAPTMLLDEAEWLSGGDSDKNGVMMDILKSGFTQTGTVKRCSPDDYQVESFSTFSPKALAGIARLENVLKDRTIMINLKKRLPTEVVEKYTDSDELKEQQSDIRDRLYQFGLVYGPGIALLYKENFVNIVGLAGMSNRTEDLWSPLMAISNVIDAHYSSTPAHPITDKLRNMAIESNNDRTEDDADENDTVITLRMVDDILRECEGGRNEIGEVKTFFTDDVKSFVDAKRYYPFPVTKTRLTRDLKKVGIRTTNINDGSTRRAYLFDRSIIRDYELRYVPTESVTQSEYTETNLSLNELIELQ